MNDLLKTMLSRRKFLTLSAGLAGSTLLPVGRSAANATTKRLDIAIVGGGMAGLYCAYRLASESNATIGLFEASDRVGGRVLSVLFEGFENLAAEIGAMRLPSTDGIPLKLAETLLGRSSLMPFDPPTNGYYLRNRRLDDVADPDHLPYFLDDEEIRILSEGGNLIVETIKSLASDREALRDHGLRELILRLRSQDGFHFMEDSIGYDTPFANWDALAAADWFLADFTPDTEYLAVRGGLERVPDAMARSAATAGAGISINSKLTAIEKVGASAFRLGIRAAETAMEVLADHVILAIPPAQLAMVDDRSGILSSGALAAALSAVQPKGVGKIYMSFDTPWWHEAGFTEGRLVTDLSLRQSFAVGQDERSGRGLLMASYHDARHNEFWRSLNRGPLFADGTWVDTAKGVNGQPLSDTIASDIPASRLLAEEAIRQTRTLYGTAGSAPNPLAASYRDWSVEASGAGWHQWAIGTDPDRTISFLRQPLPGLHVCGEAWSREQGWVAGAVKTAEDLLVEQFGLPPFA